MKLIQSSSQRDFVCYGDKKLWSIMYLIQDGSHIISHLNKTVDYQDDRWYFSRLFTLIVDANSVHLLLKSGRHDFFHDSTIEKRSRCAGPLERDSFNDEQPLVIIIQMKILHKTEKSTALNFSLLFTEFSIWDEEEIKPFACFSDNYDLWHAIPDFTFKFL